MQIDFNPYTMSAFKPKWLMDENIQRVVDARYAQKVQLVNRLVEKGDIIGARIAGEQPESGPVYSTEQQPVDLRDIKNVLSGTAKTTQESTEQAKRIIEAIRQESSALKDITGNIASSVSEIPELNKRFETILDFKTIQLPPVPDRSFLPQIPQFQIPVSPDEKKQEAKRSPKRAPVGSPRRGTRVRKPPNRFTPEELNDVRRKLKVTPKKEEQNKSSALQNLITPEFKQAISSRRQAIGDSSDDENFGSGMRKGRGLRKSTTGYTGDLSRDLLNTKINVLSGEKKAGNLEVKKPLKKLIGQAIKKGLLTKKQAQKLMK